MARNQLTDFLQVGKFHILDVSISIPFVLLPVFGFARCSLPEVSADIFKIKEGNYEFARKVTKGADVGAITLEQGVSIFNSDFGDWMRKSLVGQVGPKNLLIIQFSRINPADDPSLSGDFGGLFGFEFAKRVPGRAWYCKGCRPSRFKPGSDFDGMSQEISVASLDIEIEEFTELSLGV